MTNAPKVIAAKASALNTAIVTLLDDATASAKTADRKAREAAEIAADKECLDVTESLARCDAIVALYAEHLGTATVKTSFSAALAIIIADKPVRVSATAKTVAASGAVTFKAPEALPPVAEINETIDDGRAVHELTPCEAVDTMTSNLLKACATKAREAMGKVKGAGGRKATSKPQRAGFMDELVVVLRDKDLAASMWAIISTDAKVNHATLERCAEVCRNAGFTVSKKATKKD